MFSVTFRHISPARSFLVFPKKAEEKAQKAGKETLTDEEVERLALSATEEHEIMVAQNKENEKRSANLSNSRQ